MLPATRDNDQGSASGQANVPVCPRGMGEAGKSSWVRVMRCRGPWLCWNRQSGGGTDLKKKKNSSQAEKSWHRRGLDTDNAGVAVGSSPSHMEEM